VLELDVPASGRLTLGVAADFDRSFLGDGFDNPGAYRLVFLPQPAAIGSITGRVVDARTGVPLSADGADRTLVTLERCRGELCNEYVTAQVADAEGRFRFRLDDDGTRIATGAFELRFITDDFVEKSVRVDIGENEALELGDVALVGLPIQITDIRPCGSFLPQGSTCRYSARIVNRTGQDLNGLAFSFVTAGPFGRFTSFEASTRRGAPDVTRAPLAIPDGGSQDVSFVFQVPAFLGDFDSVCTALVVGTEPAPLLDVARTRSLFCMRRGSSGFDVLSPEQSQPLFDRMVESEK